MDFIVFVHRRQLRNSSLSIRAINCSAWWRRLNIWLNVLSMGQTYRIYIFSIGYYDHNQQPTEPLLYLYVLCTIAHITSLRLFYAMCFEMFAGIRKDKWAWRRKDCVLCERSFKWWRWWWYSSHQCGSAVDNWAEANRKGIFGVKLICFDAKPLSAGCCPHKIINAGQS